MAGVKMRSTRKLRAWIVEQVNSGKYPGLMWDDECKTMFRIPWKHAGKQDFRKDEDAAIFRAWAEFKGKMSEREQNNPAAWKTRLRCALSKSAEFQEVTERAQLDISEAYKVYRLVPFNEQGVIVPEKKGKALAKKTLKRRKSSCDSKSEDDSCAKKIKSEEVSVLYDDPALEIEIPPLAGEPSDLTNFTTATIQGEVMDELRFDLRIQESVPDPTGDQDSFNVVVHYLGQEVMRRQIQGTDVRIQYLPSSPVPPTPAVMKSTFPRISLPEPPSTLQAGQELQALFTLLPFMEKGVLLTSTPQGVYGKRYCQGRVFWRGPHMSTPGLHKMERNTDPVLLFSKDQFRQQLENFHPGGEPPQCSVTLCFGEELSNTEDTSGKLIIVKITFPWAEQQVQSSQSLHSISILHALASQSPTGEITLNLVPLSSPFSETNSCGSVVALCPPGGGITSK